MQVRSRCPMCQRESVGPADTYLIYVCMNHTGRNFYTFRCALCGEAASVRCDTIIEHLLAQAGVKRKPYRLPDEINDPQRKGPPLTTDDLLDLLNDLHSLEAA